MTVQFKMALKLFVFVVFTMESCFVAARLNFFCLLVLSDASLFSIFVLSLVKSY